MYSRHIEEAGVATAAALNAQTNLCRREPEGRQANIEFLIGSLQLASDLSVPIVVTGGGGKDAYGYERWFFDWTVQALNRLFPLAERLGVSVVLECGNPPDSLIYNVKTLERLLAVEGLDSVQVLFDPAHYYIRGDSPLEVFQDRIAHIHSKNSVGNLENIVFPPLGQGKVDFDGLLDALAIIEFDGFIAVEYKAFAWDFPKDYQTVLPREKAFLDRLITSHWKDC